jgi:predicted nucleic acid-binding protein
MGLIADLAPGPVAVDTAVFIYFIEEDPRYLAEVLPLFMEADRGARMLVTSALTLLEVLVVPFRAGNRELADRYERVLTHGRGLRMIDITQDLVRSAAHLRAATGVKTPDALQLAACFAAGCRTFVTNDRRLPEIPGVNVIQLSKYVA